MYTSTGTLRYFDDPYKLIVEVDPGIVEYYRNFLSIKLNKQLHPPHISVVRNEVPVNLDKWEIYEGKEIDFEYSNDVQCGKVYYWLEAYSQELEDIRIELGLVAQNDITRPPDHHKCFHITIGNLKNL